MRKGFRIYEEMREYLVIYEEAGSHMTLPSGHLLLYFKETVTSFLLNVRLYVNSREMIIGRLGRCVK